MESFGRPLEIAYKGVINPVTDVDHASDALIAGVLRQAFPEYGILGEEGDVQPQTGTRWIVDPLDGTTNYAHGYPFFSVSIALERKDGIVLGVVYNPLLDELFTAEKGRGAALNGLPIRAAGTKDVGRVVLASGFPYDAWTSPRDNGEEFRRFIKRAFTLRSDGSAALDLCHVACGRLDGFWELDLEAWDMAAGVLMVTEAGGRVTLANGQPVDAYKRSVLAANPRLHEEMLKILTGHAAF